MLKRLLPADRTKRLELFAYISLLFAMISYGASYFAMKVALFHYSPITTMTFRLLVSSAVFMPFMFTMYRKIEIKNSDIWLILLMTLCEPCLYYIFEGHALSYTTSSQAGIVSSMLPLFVTIGAIIILKEKVPLIAFVGFFIAITGSIILSCDSRVTEIAPNPILGNTLEFFAIAMTSISIITTKYLMERYPPFFLAAFQTISGGIFFTCLNYIQGGGFHIDFNITFLIIIYLGLVTVSDYALYNFAMCTLSATRASAFLYLQPVFAIFFGTLFLKETFTPLQILAIVLIFTGLILCQRKMIVRARKIAKNIKCTIRRDNKDTKISK